MTCIQTKGKQGSYIVETDERIQIVDSGRSLVLANILLTDDEYFSCGILDEEKYTFQSLGSFLVLFFRVKISIANDNCSDCSLSVSPNSGGQRCCGRDRNDPASLQPELFDFLQ